MAISNYTELQTAVANWLNRSDLTARIPEFIALAEAQMNRRLRVRQMVTRNSTCAINAEYVNQPSDLLQPIRFTYTVSGALRDLEFLSPERAADTKLDLLSPSQPIYVSMVGTQFQFLPTPNATFTGELTYYASIPPLATNPTNWLLTLAPDAYLYGACMQAAPYLVDDERITTWAGLFTNALNDVQVSNRVSKGKLRTDLLPLIGSTTFNINTGM